MTSFYLDSNILIAHFSNHPSESTKKKEVSDALAVFAQAKGVQLCTSLWSVAEMMNVLIHGKQMDRGAVFEIESRLLGESRLANLKLHFLEVSPRQDYNFKEFFFHVRQGILKYHSGIGDIIHSVIMENHSITRVLTFDEKDDFKKILGLTVIHPRDVKLSFEDA